MCYLRMRVKCAPASNVLWSSHKLDRIAAKANNSFLSLSLSLSLSLPIEKWCNQWLNRCRHTSSNDAISLRLCTLAYIRSNGVNILHLCTSFFFIIFPIHFDLHAWNSRIIPIFPTNCNCLNDKGGGRTTWKIKWFKHCWTNLIYLLQRRFGRITVCTDFHNQFYYEFHFISAMTQNYRFSDYLNH